MFLGFDTELEDHGQCRDPRAASLGSLGTKAHCGKGGFYRVGRSQMRPVLGWEVIKSKQPFFVFFQAVGCFWVLGLVTGDELIISCPRLDVI